MKSVLAARSLGLVLLTCALEGNHALWDFRRDFLGDLVLVLLLLLKLLSVGTACALATILLRCCRPLALLLPGGGGCLAHRLLISPLIHVFSLILF